MRCTVTSFIYVNEGLPLMRCYHFCNYYYSQIQHGIQSAHAQMELFIKYRQPDQKTTISLYEWATNHKTMICLNVGSNKHLMELLKLLEDNTNQHPWSTFYEEPGSVSHIETLTNIAIVLPEKVYNCPISDFHIDHTIDLAETGDYDSDYIRSHNLFELQLIKFMRQCRLA